MLTLAIIQHGLSYTSGSPGNKGLLGYFFGCSTGDPEYSKSTLVANYIACSREFHAVLGIVR